jgi:hypothetical protein
MRVPPWLNISVGVLAIVAGVLASSVGAYQCLLLVPLGAFAVALGAGAMSRRSALNCEPSGMLLDHGSKPTEERHQP